jgi:hypothetical protein
MPHSDDGISGSTRAGTDEQISPAGFSDAFVDLVARVRGSLTVAGPGQRNETAGTGHEL